MTEFRVLGGGGNIGTTIGFWVLGSNPWRGGGGGGGM